MEVFSFISDIINEKLGECDVLWFSFKGNKPDIIHDDGETVSTRSTLLETNSNTNILTDVFINDTLNTNSDNTKPLHVCPTEVFHWKNNAIYVSVYLRHTHQIRWCQLWRTVACLPGESRLRRALHQGRPEDPLDAS